MGLFSFGGSKGSSSSSSEQIGLGYGYQGAESGSESLGTSRSVSGGQSGQSIAFEDIFANLYGGASNVAGQLATQTPALTAQANQLFSGGARFLDALGGGADTAYQAERLSSANPILQEQIDALGGDIGRFFSEQINPAITSQAVAGGQLGGGRQGVAQGAAAAAAGREFQQGATALRAGDIAARDAVAANMGASRVGAAGTGLGALPGLYGVAEAGFNAPLSPYSALSDIVGGPTTLTDASNFAEASSDDIARAFSSSFGEDFSYDYGKTTSKSKSKSFSLGF